jgi:hypothetical protein
VSSLSLVPHEPGPYPAGGRTVVIDVYFNNGEGQHLKIRQATLDFWGSDPALEFSSTLDFDTSMLASDELYGENDQMPQVWMAYVAGDPWPGLMIEVEEGASYHVGTFEVTLPATEGTYTLDAGTFEPGEPSPTYFMWSFNRPPHYARPVNLALDLVVVPEPTAVVLPALGGAVVWQGRHRRC